MKSILAAIMLSFPFGASAIVFGHDASWGQNETDQVVREVSVRILQIKPTGEEFVCSGVQIESDTILTAGHCIMAPDVQESMKRGLLVIESFDPKAPNNRSRLPVKSMEGGDTNEIDFAVMNVRGAMPSKQSLPIAYYGCDQDSPYLLAGFGRTETGDVSKHLKIAPYAAAAAADAKIVQKKFAPTSKRVVLQPIGDGLGCKGDSGGPVFCLKHGKVALAGVLNTVHASMGPQSIRNDLSSTVYCRDWSTYIGVTKVSDGMKQIEAWRNVPSESTASTQKTGASPAANR